MEQHQVKINENFCVGCGICAKICPTHNIEVKNQKANTVMETCLLCGHCTAVCPKNAISINNQEQAIEKQEEIRLNPKQVLDVIRFRRTIRQFKQQEIPQEVLHQILEAGRLTHTAKNTQDVSFIVLDQQKNKFEQMAVNLFRKLKPVAGLFNEMVRKNEIDDDFFFFKAPIAIVILANDKTNGLLAAQNMEFVAEANGLGVLFSGFFTTALNHSKKMKREMNLPKGKQAAMTLVLGYPNTKFLRSVPRKALDVNYL